MSKELKREKKIFKVKDFIVALEKYDDDLVIKKQGGGPDNWEPELLRVNKELWIK